MAFNNFVDCPAVLFVLAEINEDFSEI